MTDKRPALFLDRDGTIIEDAHYLSDASKVQLISGAARAIAEANEASVPAIVVTNQSGIARGLITIAQYEAVRARIDVLLEMHGARVNATFHCPHAPDAHPGDCNCRKPALGMYLDAEKKLGVDLANSAYIGDRWRDVEPATKLGGRGILVPSGETPAADIARARTEARVLDTLADAVNDALTWIASRVASPAASDAKSNSGSHP